MEGKFIDAINLSSTVLNRRYGIQVDPGNPCQFCSLMRGLGDKDPVCVTAYPASWRVERAQDSIYRGFEYVRWDFGLNSAQHTGTDR